MPDALRVMELGARGWSSAVAALGRRPVPSFEEQAIAELPNARLKLRLQVGQKLSAHSTQGWNGPDAIHALERIAPSVRYRLDAVGHLRQLLAEADDVAFGPEPPLGRLLVLALDHIGALPSKVRAAFDAVKLPPGETAWPVRGYYYLCPELLEARMHSPVGDCDAITEALFAQKCNVSDLPSKHPRRQLLTAMTLRQRAVAELGADGADLHYWLELVRGAPRMIL